MHPLQNKALKIKQHKDGMKKNQIEKIKNSHIVLQVKLKEISRRDIVQWS